MAQRYRLGDGLAQLFMSMDNDIGRDAYHRAMIENMQRDKLGLDIQASRGRQRARAGLADAFAALGLDSPEAAATIVQASDQFNPSQVGDFQLDLLTRSFLTGARDTYDAGDTERANFMLRAAGRQPLEMTDVKGGVAFNPNLRPGATEMVETPAHRAQVAAGNDDGFKPLTGTLADAFMQPVVDQEGRPVTNPITGEVAMQFDADAFRDFQTWHQTSGIPDQNRALAVYLSQQGGATEPADPVMAAAARAIANGKDPEAVRQRLAQLGYSPEDIERGLSGGAR